MNCALNDYQTTNIQAQVKQAKPIELFLMLVDGLLSEIACLKSYIKNKNYENKANSIAKCSDILSGLSGALETNSDNKITENLINLYNFCSEYLHLAGIEMNLKKVKEIENLIQDLHKDWHRIK